MSGFVSQEDVVFLLYKYFPEVTFSVRVDPSGLKTKYIVSRVLEIPQKESSSKKRSVTAKKI